MNLEPEFIDKVIFKKQLNELTASPYLDVGPRGIFHFFNIIDAVNHLRVFPITSGQEKLKQERLEFKNTVMTNHL